MHQYIVTFHSDPSAFLEVEEAEKKTGKPFSMSFFGFETSNLEQDKKKFFEGGLQESEDLAVYTWGEESYDGLGDALQEGGDELNDETFGETGVVGQSIPPSVLGS